MLEHIGNPSNPILIKNILDGAASIISYPTRMHPSFNDPRIIFSANLQ